MTINHNIQLVAMTAMAFIVLAFVAGVVAQVTTEKTVMRTLPANCADKFDEVNVVANIATATGRLPGSVQTAPTGTRFAVDPHLCDPK